MAPGKIINLMAVQGALATSADRVLAARVTSREIPLIEKDSPDAWHNIYALPRQSVIRGALMASCIALGSRP
jgi:hypothetical protein